MKNSNGFVDESFRRRKRKLYLSLGLGAFAVFFGARHLAGVLEQRLTAPRTLTFRVSRIVPTAARAAKPVSGSPATLSHFTLDVSGLGRFRDGYNSRKWTTQRLQFRPHARAPWRVLALAKQAPSQIFLSWGDEVQLPSGDKQLVFDISFYEPQTFRFPVGEYQMRARFDAEFHDNQSGALYLGSRVFDLGFRRDKARKIHLDFVK